MTRFQRIHLGIGLALLAATAVLPLRAQTVTFDEAVRINLSLAAQLCNIHPVSSQERAQRFIAAGFAATVDRSTSNSDTTYTFTAPGASVTAELYFGEMPEDCRVSTEHLGVTAASAILDTVVPRLYPTFVRRVTIGPVNSTTGQPAQCVNYDDPTNPIGLTIGVLAPEGGCTETGRALIYSSYRV